MKQTADRPGSLLTVDAQPDHTMTRKRFWEGNFLFEDDVPSAGPGFKAFRPIVYLAGADSPPKMLDNAALVGSPAFASYSLEQDQLAPEDFYARVGQLMNPAGLSPQQAYEAALDALVEQLQARVISVSKVEGYFRKNPAAVIPMPEGNAIFETVGPWEDYATPSRDMRPIIAMNVLERFPDRLIQYPELFVLGDQSPQAAKAEIERVHAEAIQQRGIFYLRSDGSSWPLSAAEVLER